MYTYLADKNKPDQVSIISQDEIIRRITGDEELKTEVSEIRRLTKRYEQSNDLADRNEKEALKTKLPAFVPAGEFSYRDTKSLTKYRGRIVMDIDKIKDPERLRALIKSNREPSVIMAFLSPSGNGLKVIHQLDCPDLKSIEETGDFHKQAFLSLINLYKSKYKVTEIDLSGSDLCRLCYYSFDDKAYYNPDAKSWTFEYRTKTERSISTLNSKIEGYYPRSGNDPERANLKVVQNIIHWSMNENVSLLDNYNDWIRVMFALKNTFGNSKIGFELFSQLSSTSYKYKPEECTRKWEENTADNNGQMATIGTIIYLAKKNGWRPPRALHIGLNSDVNTKITELEENNIRVRRNELSHQFHYAESIDKDIWILGDEYLFSKIKLTLFGFTTKTEAVVDLLNYISPKFNPVKDFLSSLPEWDGRDRFSELIATLTLKNTADLKMAESLLRKWMIGVINGLHNCPENSGNSSISPNENMLILIGPQGIGKTRWMWKLAPEKWKNTIFAEKLSFDFSSKDDHLLSCQKAIIALDELYPVLYDRATNEQLKGFLSQKTFSIRVPYGKANTDFYKIASFIGTSNHSEIITDTTGSRRFWPIEITNAEHKHEVDMYQLWSQAYALWNAGEQHWLSREQQEELSKYNEQYTKIHPYEEYINRFVRHGNEQYTATQIAEFINEQLQNKNAVNPKHLGVYLKKAGYFNVSRTINKGTHRVYSVFLVVRPTGLIEATIMRVQNETDSELAF